MSRVAEWLPKCFVRAVILSQVACIIATGISAIMVMLLVLCRAYRRLVGAVGARVLIGLLPSRPRTGFLLWGGLPVYFEGREMAALFSKEKYPLFN